jgi:hypothetical protein
MYDDLEKNKEAPKDIDGASAGRKFKKDEPGMPEQPGSRIRVDGKPVKKMAKGGSSDTPQFKVPIQKLPYMGEKPEARTPPPAQRSRTNADIKMPDKNYKGGGMTASSRADGCCTKGKTKGRFV